MTVSYSFDILPWNSFLRILGERNRVSATGSVSRSYPAIHSPVIVEHLAGVRHLVHIGFSGFLIATCIASVTFVVAGHPITFPGVPRRYNSISAPGRYPQRYTPITGPG